MSATQDVITHVNPSHFICVCTCVILFNQFYLKFTLGAEDYFCTCKCLTDPHEFQAKDGSTVRGSTLDIAIHAEVRKELTKTSMTISN